MWKKNSIKLQPFFLIALCMLILPFRMMGQSGYVMTCNQPTDICNIFTFPPPELTVTPAGASLYEFYGYNEYTGIYMLLQSGPDNVVPIDYLSTHYYCQVTDNAGTSQTNFIYMRCIFPDLFSINSSAGSSTVCGGAILTMTPAVWDSYQWYRNGVAVAGATSASYAAILAGNYNCFVTNSCGGDSASNGQIISKVDPVLPAVPVITVTPAASLCVGKPVTLVAPAVPGCTYTWYRYLQTGYTLNLASGVDVDTVPAGGNAETGSQHFSVSMQNACGVKGSAIITVIWTQVINPSFATSGPAQFCPGGNVTLSATQNNAWSYQWSKNNVNISGATQNSYNAVSTGSYRLIVTDANGCANSNFVTDVSASGPDARTNSSAPFCTNTPEFVYTGNGTGFSYQWYKNNTLIPGATNDTFPVTSAGNGSFYVIVNSACGSDTSAPVQKTFYAPATAGITAFGDTTFCSGDSVRLFGTSGTNYTYRWSKNGIDLSYSEYYYYTARSTGSYQVLVSNAQGCGTLSAGLQVTAINKPAPVVTANGPTSFCYGNSVLLNTASTAGATYQWKKNNVNITGATSFSYAASTTGNYKVEKTNASGCSGSSAGKQVTANSIPATTIAPQGPTTFCAGDSVLLKANYSSSFSYQWKKNNTNISNATTHKYYAKTAGSYKVKVTNANGCTAISNTVTVTVPCREAMESAESNTGLHILAYPNPSEDNFIFEMQAGEVNKEIRLEIFDISGRLVRSEDKLQLPFTMDAESLQAGIYFATVIQGEKHEMIKLIKTK
jgi:hypothetical protein